ncbi:MAG TPA: DedA family protein [Actinomycetaceae bacterium]|nr:DedA family protein [Actinomycetaceae bacterium]
MLTTPSALLAAPLAAISTAPMAQAAFSVSAEIATTEELTGIAKWSVEIIEWLGGPGVAFLIALENLFPPLPSEVILPLAGFTASLGSFSLLAAILWSITGSVFGAGALYYVGYVLGRERTRKLMGALPLVNVNDVIKTEAWFDKHGHWTVLIGRLIPIFRSLISIPAGVTGMPLPKFLALTTLGSTVWNVILVSAGFILGENWHLIEPYIDVLSDIVIVTVIVLVAVFVVWRLTHRPKTLATAEE